MKTIQSLLTLKKIKEDKLQQLLLKKQNIENVKEANILKIEAIKINIIKEREINEQLIALSTFDAFEKHAEKEILFFIQHNLDLQEQLIRLNTLIYQMFAEMKTFDTIASYQLEEKKKENNKKEQDELDEIGLMNPILE